MDAAIQLQDLEETAQVLAACLTYFQAEDLQKAQAAFSSPRPSPLTVEIDRVLTRVRGCIGDALMAAREAELEADDPEDEDAETEAENDSSVDEEALSSSPLGEFNPPKREGRRLTVEEIRGETEEA